MIIFLPPKYNITLFHIWIVFIIPSLIFSQLELPKLTPSILKAYFKPPKKY